MSAIGVMGEDRTDCETIKVLLRRMIPNTLGIPMRCPPRGGCAALRRAAATYMKELERAGCVAVVLVHDLDRNPLNDELNHEPRLRATLGAISVPPGLERLLCIPVEELEAWFWSDQGVIDRVGKGHGKASPSPHSIRQPKEALTALSARAHRKPVYSTNMNKELAASLDLDLCAERCPSFRDLRTFAVRVAARR